MLLPAATAAALGAAGLQLAPAPADGLRSTGSASIPSVSAATSSVSAAAREAPVASAVPRRGWGWPLDPAPAVARPFHAPPTPWSAGHRGVDLRALVGQPVLSAAAGRVTFAGAVAGRGVVVVTHAGGLRTSYEPLASAPPVGTVVARGQRIGVLAGTAGHCAPAACLHLGLRQGAVYLDPLSLIDAGPPVLKPLSG
jgi:murein DD-endopeptidase MepM/ murein hydrolase activator NlpD